MLSGVQVTALWLGGPGRRQSFNAKASAVGSAARRTELRLAGPGAYRGLFAAKTPEVAPVPVLSAAVATAITATGFTPRVTVTF